MVVGELECQGRLVQCRLVEEEREQGQKRPSGKRGEIRGFSRKSRRRLLDLCSKLDHKRIGRRKGQMYPAFLTLTYGATFPSGAESKKDLDSMLKWLERRSCRGCGIWRLEFQERGAPHYHLILLGVSYIAKEKIQAAWNKIIKEDRVFTRIEGLQSAKQAMGYVAKYVAKVPEEGQAQCGFNLGPYSTAPSTGRFWGVWQRKNLPMASKVKLEVRAETFYALRRAAAKVRRWEELKRFKSFRVYGNAEAWVRLALYYEARPLRI